MLSVYSEITRVYVQDLYPTQSLQLRVLYEFLFIYSNTQWTQPPLAVITLRFVNFMIRARDSIRLSLTTRVVDPEWFIPDPALATIFWSSCSFSFCWIRNNDSESGSRKTFRIRPYPDPQHCWQHTDANLHFQNYPILQLNFTPILYAKLENSLKANSAPFLIIAKAIRFSIQFLRVTKHPPLFCV